MIKSKSNLIFLFSFKCTVMLYSSNVHFNGLWSRSICSVSDQNYFICQATPVQAYSVNSTKGTNKNLAYDLGILADKPYCPIGSTLSFYNYSAKVMDGKLHLPNCLQLVNSRPMDWKVSLILVEFRVTLRVRRFFVRWRGREGGREYGKLGYQIQILSQDLTLEVCCLITYAVVD